MFNYSPVICILTAGKNTLLESLPFNTWNTALEQIKYKLGQNYKLHREFQCVLKMFCYTLIIDWGCGKSSL